MRSKSWMLVVCWLVAPLACGDGYSTSEATEHCQAEQDAPETQCTSFPMAECIACHEQCGDHCATVGTADPCTFVCPE